MGSPNWAEADSVKAKKLWVQYQQQYDLADRVGQTIEEDVYLVEFPFDGQIVQAEATFVLGTQILMGTHLLRDYRLTVDFVGKTVELERVAKPQV